MLVKFFFTVSFYTALSRVSGYVRDIFTAKYVGAGPLSDAFFIALRVPNFFRRFFAEGAFNSSFIPLFSSKLETEGREKAKLFAEHIFILMFITLLVFSAIFMLFMPYLIYLIAPGFYSKPEIRDLTIELTRITFPYLMLISIATIFGAILNSLSKFSAVAFMPVLFNVAIVILLVGFGKHFKSYVHAMAWGVFTAGLLQIFWILYFLKKNGYLLRLKLGFLKITPDLRQFLRQVTPAAMGGSVVQINLWVDMMIASFFSGAVSFLYYADRVAQLPLSIIGTAMGTALLPVLSRKIGSGDMAEASKMQENALEIVLLLTIPASLALMSLPVDIMHVLFVRGEFTDFDARMSAYAMAAFAFGLPAFALIKIFSSCFFAFKDTKTPVISATIAMIINVVLNIIFVFALRAAGIPPHIGIALATSLAGWCNAFYLGKKLFRNKNIIFTPLFRIRIIKIIISAATMMIALLAMTSYLKSDTLNLAVEIVIGGGIYSVMILILKAYPINELKKYISRKNRAA